MAFKKVAYNFKDLDGKVLKPGKHPEQVLSSNRRIQNSSPGLV
jgi:hypothetical protein